MGFFHHENAKFLPSQQKVTEHFTKLPKYRFNIDWHTIRHI